MRYRTVRSCLAILSSLLLAGSPVQGRSVEIHEVIQNSAVPAGTLGRFTSSSLIASAIVIPNEQEQSRVEKSGGGTVQGTVCDCGEILVGGEAFPKWPLLFLTAIPFFFIPRGDDSTTPDPTPTPVPTTTPTAPSSVPESGSLLLFGSGLAAFLFRLRRRSKAKNLLSNTTEAANGWRIQK